jgi:protein ImuB
VLVWRTVGPRREVTAVSGVQGVRPGQALSDAQAVAPEALAVEADPAADVALLESVALWAMRFSPLVATDDDALILDVTGVTHLFGGEASVLRRAVEGLGRLGLTACGVVAGAPGTALALARSGITGRVVLPGEEAEAVSELGLSVLPVDPDVVTALARMGLRRIGQIRQQPRAPLARRFGAALLRALDEAAGEVSAPISPIRPPLDFSVASEFLEPLITRDAIDIALDGLLQQLCCKLAAAGRGVRRVLLRAHRVDGGVQEIGIGLHLASRDPAHMARLFAQRLEGLEPGFGFDRIELGAEITEEMTGAQAGFMGGALQQEELAQLLDRLAQRVEVWRLAPRASHWPEREVVRVPAISVVQAPPGWPRAPRPLLLLRRPLEVGAMALLPDAPPSLLRIGRIGHRVRHAEGPERLEPEWWRDPPDRPGRDYYRVELTSGVRLWVCRSGFGEAARWFVQGRL